MDKVIRSPIIYPGSKFWLFPTFMRYFPKDTKEIISPFFGGGTLELNLAYRGIQVKGYDLFQPIVNFWQHWLKSAHCVIEHANEYLNIYTNKELQGIKKQRYPDVCMDSVFGASMYYVLNRLGFSGGVSSHVKPFYLRHDGHYISGRRPTRPNGERVFANAELWETQPNMPISVEYKDYKDSLAESPNTFAFLDPPYPVVSGLYGKGKKYHKDFDHYTLRAMLANRDNWIMTYNDIPFIRNLYSDFRHLEIKRRNDCWGKNKNELLIFSHDIAERLEYKQLTLDFS